MSARLLAACRALVAADDAGYSTEEAIAVVRSALAEADADAERQRKRDAVANCPRHEWLRGPMGVYVCRHCPGVRS